MIPALTRRVRIVTATIVVLIVVALLFAPTSVFSIVAGSDDHPLLPAPPTSGLASGKTASPGKQHVQRKQDVQPGRPISEHDTSDDGIRPGIDHLEHQAEELIGALLSDDPIELTQIPISLDGDGLLDGFDSLQAGHLPSYPPDNGGSGFLRGGVPFLLGVGGFGGAASGGGSMSHSESTDGSDAGRSGNSDAVDRGTEPDVSQPGVTENGPEPDIVPRIEDGEIVIDAVPKNPEVPGSGGDGSGVEPRSGGNPDPVTPVTVPDPVAPVAVPEPASLLLTAFGLASLVARNRRAVHAARRRAGLADSHIAEEHAANRL